MRNCWVDKPAARPTFQKLQTELHGALNKQCPEKSLIPPAEENEFQDQRATETVCILFFPIDNNY